MIRIIISKTVQSTWWTSAPFFPTVMQESFKWNLPFLALFKYYSVANNYFLKQLLVMTSFTRGKYRRSTISLITIWYLQITSLSHRWLKDFQLTGTEKQQIITFENLKPVNRCYLRLFRLQLLHFCRSTNQAVTLVRWQ